jgi:hypothetical protein
MKDPMTDLPLVERKKPGPKPSMVGRRSINVGMTDETIEKARTLGRGNLSAGVRVAVDMAWRKE